MKPLYSKSYKMVWPEAGPLKDGLSWSCNFDKMSQFYPGQVFLAKRAENHSNRFGVLAQKPVFHFCDNAVDTLLWFWEVFDCLDDDKPVVNFLEIKPMGRIYKNQAPDETQLWQCGVNQFKVMRKVDIKRVAQDACKEIEHSYQEIIARYPHYDMIEYIQKIKRQAQK